ncbi:hypothetical protein PR202_ga22493 [Eleusine coracana subsp. coracana]|uniref:non-specific serine/threonine protein kinase n=1 Tax=Eleusine coracana subsp. coracana TaxID=191504 RepID=A0AAV5D3M2_ELECO|nr:hypothetical protein PR202_ga22493 [Eleusine coracana subsp. coracana]
MNLPGHGNLESILQDPSAKPRALRFQQLKEITNNFSKDRQLGKGGFGIVYKGLLPNGKAVAVKDLIMSQLQEKQFKREVDNLMKVQHKNIVRFLGYCYESSRQYIEYEAKHVFAESPKMLLCFEYVANGSLDKYINVESCGFDWHKRYKIIKGICHGLHYLHEECQPHGSVIHLDLKPENILLDDRMVPKIADFGISKFFSDQKLETRATIAIGSLGYMAPEYISANIVSKMADIYSLGVIIMQIITGRRIDVTSCEDIVESVRICWI